jgi:phospholipase C
MRSVVTNITSASPTNRSHTESPGEFYVAQGFDRLWLLPAAETHQEPNRAAKPQPVPNRPGEPSTIDHVVYIVKENRSYDQYFGSLGK